jgi:hypothetical protein
MTTLARAVFAVSIAVATIALTSIQPMPAIAFTQIGEEAGKCNQNDKKKCACKDSACAQRSETTDANKKSAKPSVPKASGMTAGKKQ